MESMRESILDIRPDELADRIREDLKDVKRIMRRLGSLACSRDEQESEYSEALDEAYIVQQRLLDTVTVLTLRAKGH